MDIKHFATQKQHRSIKKVAEGAWDGGQKRCADIYRSTCCEAVLVMLVVISFALVVLEADYGDVAVPEWLSAMNNALMWLYAVEMVIRFFIFRRWFFTKTLNIFDLLVVVTELTSHFLVSISPAEMPSITPLRIVRLIRVARGYKVLVKFPQLALMVKGLIGGASAALYGVGLLLILLSIWGVFAVHFIHPINERLSLTGIHDGCDRCPYAFANVRSSMLTFIQQIIAGDSWGQVTVPIIEAAPETCAFFGLVFISVQFTMMNVILAVIVDSSLKASAEDVDNMLKQKHESIEVAQNLLMEICKEMDEDKSGDLTKDEIMAGFDKHQEFSEILASMDIKKEDMSIVFNILDADGNGYVDYTEFIAELFKMKQHDSHTMLVFIKHYAKEIRRDVADQLSILKSSMQEMEDEIRAATPAGRRSMLSMDGPFEEKQRPEVVDSRLFEARSLRLEFGEEFQNLNKVVNQQLMVSLQEISRKLQLQEDGFKVPGSGRGLKGLKAAQLRAPDLTLPKQRPEVEGLELPVQVEDSVQMSPRASQVVLPPSAWGIRTRCEDPAQPRAPVPTWNPWRS